MSAGLLKVSAVVFDLDGTLIDSRRDIAESANHALELAGLGRLPVAELESYVGDGAPLLMARAARLDVKDEKVSRMVADFLDYYAANPIANTDLMPGALETLEALGGYALGVCTNKPRRTSVAVLQGLKLDRRFAALVAGDDLPERKPDPAPVRETARRMGVAVEEVVMVGDGPQDVLSGRAAGAYTVGVRGGIQALARLEAAKPDAMIETLAELPEVIRGLVSLRVGFRHR
ncbi:MAG TPA: HAD-IA family hydrolase [Polyangiaceae bacterium]|nr:HAD-IA family hydrolase [Polyangiaceae bacterium]